MALPETTRLPRRVRKQIRRRSERQAQNIYGPELQSARKARRQVKRQYRGQRKQIQKTYRQDVHSTRQAVKGFQKILSQAQKRTTNPAYGLTGQYRQQVAQDLAMRQADVAAALPSLTAEARQTRASSLASLRQARASDVSTALQNIQGAKEDIARKAAETYASQTTSARLHRASALKSSRSDQQTKAGDLKEAVKIGSLMIATTPAAKLPWGASAIKHFGDVETAWKAFTRELLAQEGVSDPTVAAQAAAILRKRNAFPEPWALP